MRKELFETGKTVDSAIDLACEKLGCKREDCDWEIVDLPKKGFFGLKNTPAKVRVSVELPDEKPARAKKQPEQKPAAKAAEKQKPTRNPQKPDTAAPEEKAPETVKPAELNEKEKIAKEFLSQMISAMGLEAEYTVTREYDGCCINIVGDGLGMIIGRRGETLDAIQYLTCLAANRGDGEYLRLTVDCGSYRLKRRETLEALARKLANQVIKTNVSKVLEPMNPFERRVIHATVSDMEGVHSSSVGEEPMRRVVITSPTARPAPKSSFRERRQDGFDSGRAPRWNRDEGAPRHEGGQRRDSGGHNRGRRDDRGGRPPRHAQTPAPQGPPKQTPEAEATTGISFGKIDLE